MLVQVKAHPQCLLCNNKLDASNCYVRTINGKKYLESYCKACKIDLMLTRYHNTKLKIEA